MKSHQREAGPNGYKIAPRTTMPGITQDLHIEDMWAKFQELS